MNGPRKRAARRGQSEFAREIRHTMSVATKALANASDEAHCGDIEPAQLDVAVRRFEAAAREAVRIVEGRK
jgi:hypothetical protein